jgi:hypothetical protein
MVSVLTAWIKGIVMSSELNSIVTTNNKSVLVKVLANVKWSNLPATTLRAVISTLIAEYNKNEHDRVGGV